MTLHGWKLGFRLIAAFFMSLVITSPLAMAELGGKADTIENVRQSLGLREPVVRQASSYAVHQMVNDGLKVWEFVGTDGTVFAVAWQGVAHPDLTKILGDYFEDFSNAVRLSSRNPGHRGKILTGNNVVVHKWKALRLARGLAYLPAAMPAGVTVNDLGNEIQ
jgi:hypothetical protein